MKAKGNSYLYIVIIVIIATLMGLSVPMADIQTKLLPLMLGGIILVLGGVGLWGELKGKAKPAPPGSGDEKAMGWRKVLLNLAWVVGFFLGIYFVGFFIAIPLFVLAYMKWLGVKWRLAIIYAILTLGIVYAAFGIALKVELYRGLLFT